MDWRKLFGSLRPQAQPQVQPTRLEDRRELDKDKFREMMADAGLSRYTDGILGLGRTAIHLAAEPAEGEPLPVGASKLLGMPDLPPEIEWPWNELDGSALDVYGPDCARMVGEKRERDTRPSERCPLALLAQINLADLPPLARTAALPESGILYFFHDLSEEGAFRFDDPKTWRVIYYDGDLARLRRTPPPDGAPDECRCSDQRASFACRTTLPGTYSYDLPKLGMSLDEADSLVNIRNELLQVGKGDLPLHQILGWPLPIQDDVFCECVHDVLGVDWREPRLVEMSAEWRLLFQVDTIKAPDKGLTFMWGDLGMLYFCIRQDDLAARAFEKTWEIMQCM